MNRTGINAVLASIGCSVVITKSMIDTGWNKWVFAVLGVVGLICMISLLVESDNTKGVKQ